MSKSKSSIKINYKKVSLFIGLIVCFLIIAVGYGLYKKQSLSTILNNISNAVVYSNRSTVI